MKASMLGTCIFIALAATIGFAQETEPQSILKKSAEAYKSLETYSATGTITSDIDAGMGKTTVKTSFSIKLKKPNLYLISWEQNTAPTAIATQSGAVWSEGTQPYLYMGIADQKSYSKINGDEMALAGATGISGGAASTLPSLFFTGLTQLTNPFSRLIAPKLEGVEQIAGEDCYVISGSSATAKSETFWVAKKDYLIRKYTRAVEQAKGNRILPQMSEKDLEAAIKATGQEVTAVNIAAMKKMMDEMQKMTKDNNVQSLSTELHTTIDSPKLLTTDFTFKLPEGAVLKDSLFTGLAAPEVKKMNFTVKSATNAKERTRRKRR